MSPGGLVKRVAYGGLFVVGVPLLLIVWARRSAHMVHLPAVGQSSMGWSLAVVGLVLTGLGMAGLALHGGGLPMNAFPPPRFVRRGVYRWTRDPIYLGFGLAVLGASLAARSPAGLWLVTPVTWLAMAALVLGHERHDLRRRFPEESSVPLALSLPEWGPTSPTTGERLGVLVWVLGPWLLAYYAVQGLGPPPDAFSTLLPLETRWGVVEWMELPYVSAYLFVPLAVWLVRTRDALRNFALGGLVATLVVTLCWLVVPVVAVHRPFEPTSWAGSLLASEQLHSNRVAAFPAFHVLWPLLAARALSAGRRPLARGVAWGWAVLIAVSSLGTGHHGVLDAGAGALLYLPLRDVRRSWSWLTAGAERLANSWREWRVGPVRFINHGLYAGAAAAIGVVVAGSAAGPGMEPAVAWVALWALLGACMYAQVLEGSSRLLRPFGWYGGLLGGTLGVLTSPLVGGRPLPLFGAFALAAPWIQSIGRLRCLVQGCCHGAPAQEGVGIRYRHPRSRVCHLADLTDVPVFPTPLYSILGNLIIGTLLLRLRFLGAPDTLVFGLCLMLTGCARFVEESYRGEPQTPVVWGLRLYQWFAVATLLVGVLVTMIPTPPTPDLAPPSRALVLWGALFFLVGAAAMGLDFPASDRRFSRLAASGK